MRLWRAASPATREAGRTWYAAAWEIACDIYPERPDIAAGVLAALSPRCQWRVNVAWARALVAAARAGAECPAVHTTAMRAQAWRIAQGAPALDVLNGLKVRAFYSNIMGDRSAVTVDVWMARVADPRLGERFGRPAYRRVAAAITRAAEIAGVDPATMQAAVWIQARGRVA